MNSENETVAMVVSDDMFWDDVHLSLTDNVWWNRLLGCRALPLREIKEICELADEITREEEE